MEVRTHLKIDNTLCGKVIAHCDNYAKVRLQTTQVMAADERGLVHGGFTFGAADYAAMVAINDPYVVLAAAEVKFLAPVVVGDVVEFEAKVVEQEGKKAKVEVIANVHGKEVFQGLFKTFTPPHHILDRA